MFNGEDNPPIIALPQITIAIAVLLMCAGTVQLASSRNFSTDLICAFMLRYVYVHSFIAKLCGTSLPTDLTLRVLSLGDLRSFSTKQVTKYVPLSR